MSNVGEIAHDIQLVIVGVPLPDVVGRAMAVRVLPPNSPVITPVWVPCATELPFAPEFRNEFVRI